MAKITNRWIYGGRATTQQLFTIHTTHLPFIPRYNQTSISAKEEIITPEGLSTPHQKTNSLISHRWLYSNDKALISATARRSLCVTLILIVEYDRAISGIPSTGSRLRIECEKIRQVLYFPQLRASIGNNQGYTIHTTHPVTLRLLVSSNPLSEKAATPSATRRSMSKFCVFGSITLPRPRNDSQKRL